MLIRKAIEHDFPDIKRLMVDFANANPVKLLHKPEYSDTHTDAVLTQLYKYGLMLVAEDNNRVVGILLASVVSDVWLPQIKRMSEIAWWVEESYRNTTAGARLLKKYIELGIEYQEMGIISCFTLTTLASTPDMKLDKRGWKPIDFNWVFKGK
jgi:N-acetylglutamate synthase-like GNAT family acetyltransferase